MPVSIGTNLYELRTAKGLSQGDVAERLGVSRQSVSKWETDTAVPDLDKLMGLCDLFGVSLDRLAGRAEPSPPATPAPQPAEQTPSSQKAVGCILFAAALLLGLCTAWFGEDERDYVVFLPLAAVLLVCGLLCLGAGRRAWYWCVWAVLVLPAVMGPLWVGMPTVTPFLVITAITAAVLLWVARTVFQDVRVAVSRRNSVLLALGWLLPPGLCAYQIYGLVRYGEVSADPPSVGVVVYNYGFSALLNAVCYVLIAVLGTYTVCYVKSRREKHNRK